MNPIAIALTAFAFAFGGALLGVYGRVLVPETHFSTESRDVMKLAIGLIATMTALILGLVVASAKGAFDAANISLRNSSITVLALDHTLARYGPETGEIRDLLKRGVSYRIDSLWPEEKNREGHPAKLDDPEMARVFVEIEGRISRLVPRDDSQRVEKTRALSLTNDMYRDRWLLLSGSSPVVPTPFIVVLIFWLTVIFGAFGLMAPHNKTIIAVLMVSALSVAISIFLVLEMEHPLDGLIKISSTPMRLMLSHLGH